MFKVKNKTPIKQNKTKFMAPDNSKCWSVDVYQRLPTPNRTSSFFVSQFLQEAYCWDEAWLGTMGRCQDWGRRIKNGRTKIITNYEDISSRQLNHPK